MRARDKKKYITILLLLRTSIFYYSILWGLISRRPWTSFKGGPKRFLWGKRKLLMQSRRWSKRNPCKKEEEAGMHHESHARPKKILWSILSLSLSHSLSTLLCVSGAFFPAEGIAKKKQGNIERAFSPSFLSVAWVKKCPHHRIKCLKDFLFCISKVHYIIHSEKEKLLYRTQCSWQVMFPTELYHSLPSTTRNIIP